MCKLIILFFMSFLVSSVSLAKEVTFGAFLDTYYAYDTASPDQRDRAYTTQPARHDEFNVNLAFIEVQYDKSNEIKGRLALQVGTSVEANYSSEPTLGEYSNGDMVKFLQEAYLGTKVSENTWIYGGIFFSHMGLESFISRDNLTYTRSLVADFSPFYQAGVKIHHDFSKNWSAELHILNGWQVVTDSNDEKAVGMQVSYISPESYSVTYNNFIGREGEFRHFHDFTLTTQVNKNWELAFQADVGFQEKPTDGESVWYGGTFISKVMLNESTGFSQRLEYYSDKDQVIVSTNRPKGYNMASVSLGLDRQLKSGVSWRTEVRHFQSADEIIPAKANELKENHQLFVSSFSFSF